MFFINFISIALHNILFQCKFNENKGKCWFCEESFEDEYKFGKHLYRALKCRSGLIKMIERDFSQAGDEETDDPNNVTANPDVENKPAKHNQDNMQSNEKISKTRVFLCNECGIKFHGYLTYCQHQVKNIRGRFMLFSCNWCPDSIYG